MVIISVNPRRAQAGGSVDVSDFADVPGCTQVRWADGGTIEVVFSRDLSAAEQTVVINRCESLNANEEVLRQQARDALVTNRTFRNGTSQTILDGADAIINNAAATAREKQLAQGIRALAVQVRALSAQNIALGRIALQALDGTD